jgi:glycosyltransferase involved in cell wall biosynthesis
MATVIGLLTGSARSGIRHESAATWNPSSRTRGLRSTILLIYRLLSAKRSRPDWLHAHLSEGGSFLREGAVLVAARTLGIGTAATLHGAEFVAFSQRHPRLVRVVLRSCRAVFALGPRAASRVSELAPSTPLRLTLNPIDLQELADTPRSDRAGSVVFGGEVGHRKGVDRLLRAWPEVRRRHPDATCLLCGPPGDVPVDRLPEGMTYLGALPRAELLSLLKAADVACLPSRNEALPMFILESLGLGVPVVTTPVGEIGQLGESQGVALTQGDPVDLAARISDFLDDSEKRVEWGRRGAEWAHQYCSVESVSGALTEVYRSESAVPA